MSSTSKASSSPGEDSEGNSAADEPIAIIGIGCRFPGGANSPMAFWKMLCDGVDAISEIPPDRWTPDAFYDPDPGTPGKINIRSAGFIQNVDHFDPEFFGISQREAPCMDPQQRLLLEVAWQALEDAGEGVHFSRASNTGVFVGISTDDYEAFQGALQDRAFLDLYTSMGYAPSIAANRISYCLNLSGPSVALDTACSSSLTALHLACRSLRNGECATALAGGVNAILSPLAHIALGSASMLAPDGRCKTFDASADGFARAEGAGMVLLKPLSAALADGNPVYAVIRGTAINQDGRSAGITVPSRSAQEAVVKMACRAADISPDEVYYVEAHGTGTPVGDPIEVHALSAALCETRQQSEPLLVGSVKTNIGHLEAGAGVAGIIKLALMLHHRQVPPNLHFKSPNPNIPFESLKVRVPTSLEAMPDGRMLVGINSFGFGGANAHAVLESPPQEPAQSDEPADDAQGFLLTLSGRSAEVLPKLASVYAEFLKEPGGLGKICATASQRRVHHEHRLTVAGSSPEEMAARLAAFSAGDAAPGLTSGQPIAERKLVFVFSGQGPQWWGMGRQLLKTHPVFRQKIEECDRIMSQWGAWSLLEELSASEENSRMQETEIAQPAIFAIQVALAALWASWGIRPDAVLGHSVGEVAAAHVSGALNLESAARVIFQRGRCMKLAPTSGRMLAAALPLEEAMNIAARSEGRVEIAAINSPGSVTFSGEEEALQAIEKNLVERGLFCRFLHVKYAFHSQQMEPVKGALLEALEGLQCQTLQVPIYSTVTGRDAEAGDFDAAYWWRNVRNAVQFSDAVGSALEAGATTFLELGPHPVLSSSVLECAGRKAKQATVHGSLRRNENERVCLLTSLGALHVAGYVVDWKSVMPVVQRCSHLPPYPWHHRRYWRETEANLLARLPSALHPLLGRRLGMANPCWENKIDGRVRKMLDDHRVQGRVVFPAAAYMEMALACARQLSEHDSCTLEGVELHRALVIPDGSESVGLQFSFNTQEKIFQIFSRANESQAFWIMHCSGRIIEGATGATPQADIESLREVCSEEVDVATLYPRFEDMGLKYGPRFRGIQKVWRGSGEAVAQLSLPLHFEDPHYQVVPGMLDSCIQVLLAAVMPADQDANDGLFLPARVGRVRLYCKPESSVWACARINKGHRGAIEVDLQMINPNGQVALELSGFIFNAVDGARPTSGKGLEDALYQFAWHLQPLRKDIRSRRSVDYLPSWDTLIHELKDAAASRVPHGWKPLADRVGSQIDQLCALYVFRALGELGCDISPGKLIQDETLRLEVAPQHESILNRLLNMLAADGVITRQDDGWIVNTSAAETNAEDLWRSIFSQVPGYLPEATLLRTFGGKLAELLRGTSDALQLLFSDSSLLEQFYSDSLTYRGCFSVVQDALAVVVRSLPEGRPLRILEIGAGTGGLTSCVVRALTLPAEQLEYYFTDLSSHFLGKAEQKFHHCPYMRFQALDIELAPAEQGLEGAMFDVILASDVLHGTSDISRTLGNIQSVHADNGMLIVVENHRPSRWADLVFGFTKGWWSFTDNELRPDYAILSADAWREVLGGVGFERFATLTDAGILAGGSHLVMMASGHQLTQLHVELPPGLEASADPEPPLIKPKWLLFTDELGVASTVAQCLAAQDQECVLARPGEAFEERSPSDFTVRVSAKEDYARLLTHCVSNAQTLAGVVFLWGVDESSAQERTPDDLSRSLEVGCHSLLALVQSLAETATAVPLWIVTRGAQPAGNNPQIAVEHSTLWGMGRVIMNEHPRLKCRMVDLEAADETESRALFEELRSDSKEEEIALRSEARYALRLERIKATRGVSLAPAGTPFRLEITKPGVLDDLVLRPLKRRAPGKGEVEIEVHAAALNFRDLMKSLGIYPRESEAYSMLGDECAGRVVAVGADVDQFRVGDPVIVFATSSFSSHVTCPAGQVVPCPEGLTSEEAVTLPAAFTTAAWALRHIARMTKGERVLIHSATGGVGLAAVQMALCEGCEVFATAGNAEKRDFLRALGVRHVFDSHSLSFADEIMSATAGEGVDIVLNSLAGEALTKSVALLRANGRFIEIGKRDIHQNSRMGLRPFSMNISFHSLDVMSAIRHQPHVVIGLWEQILEDFKRGDLYPLPMRLFPMTDVWGAFRFMMRGTHIGKLVVTVTGRETPMLPFPKKSGFHLEPDGTYLITGGLGGFGLAAAKWLADHGARHLVLMSRSGIKSEDVQHAVDELTAASVSVEIAQADVSSPEDVTRVLNDIRSTHPPLKGVIHGAMVLDDGILLQMDAQRFQTVLAPKMAGAWNLHTQTRGDALDFFVLFSSVSSVVGNPGQANYAAANTFLDTLSHYRRSRGLPSLTINWGAIQDVGYVSRNQAVADSLARLGMKMLEVRPALDMMGRLLQTDGNQYGVIDVNWDQWTKTLGSAYPARFSNVVSHTGDDEGEFGEGKALRDAILAASGEERLRLVESFLRVHAARVLRSSAASLDLSKSMHEMGLDSLMAVELVNRIEGELGITIPPGALMGGQSLTDMAKVLTDLLDGKAPETAPPAVPAPTPEVEDGIVDESPAEEGTL